MTKQKTVLVVGATGFIGSTVVDALLAQGSMVKAMARNEKPWWDAEKMQGQLSFNCHDLYSMSFDDALAVTAGVDSVIFAAGVDERVHPEGDAYDFFARKNIEPVKKLAQAAKENGAGQFVLMNSMFSWLERECPELNLYEKHPYIRSRVDQRNFALALSTPKFRVNVFEVPYVFGVDRKGETQWRRLIDYIRATSHLIVTKGGANMLSVQTLANAAVAAVEHETVTGCYPIGDENMSWHELVDRISAMEKGVQTKADKKAHLQLPSKAFDHLSGLGGFIKQVLGLQSGLDNHYMGEIVTRNLFFDAKAVQQQIGFEASDLNADFANMLEAVPQKPRWKALLDVVAV